MADIAKRIRAARTAGRSPIFRWLLANYAELTGEVEHLRRMPWSAIATVMNERGVKLSDGKPISAHAVRKAWPRVLQEVNRDAGNLASRPQPKPAAAIRQQSTKPARLGRFSIPVSKG